MVPVKGQGKPDKTSIKQQSINQKKGSVKAGDLDPNEIGQFLVGAFGLLASIGGSHWMIEEDEAEQIANPLAQILNKMNKKRKDNIGSMMAPMLLITAAGAIIVPRVMITLAEWKEKRTNARNQNRAFERSADSNKATGGSRSMAPETAGADRATTGEVAAHDQGRDLGLPTIPPEIRESLTFSDR